MSMHDRDRQANAPETTGFESTGGHPSQAEGEDPDAPEEHPDPRTPGHPSQAEGEDPDAE